MKLDTLITLTCQGCGSDFTYEQRPGRTPKWCSERCRKRYSYGATCTRCGFTDNGSEGRRNGSFLCGECKHDEHYGEENREIVRLWTDGLTGEEIEERLGIPAQNVRGRIDVWRRIDNQPIPIHRRKDRDNWPEIERRWRRGETRTQIAAALGLRPTDVGSRVQRMRKAGIDLPYRNQR